MTIDKIDAHILRALEKNARSCFSDIAKACGVSIDTIARRYNMLKKKGIISGTTILLNPKKFDHNHIVSFGIDVNYPYHEDAINFLKEIDEIFFCTYCLGKHDLLAIGFFRDIERVSEVKDFIRSQSYFRNIATNIWAGQFLLCPENFEF